MPLLSPKVTDCCTADSALQKLARERKGEREGMGVTHLGTKQTEQRATFPGCFPALPRSSICFSAQVHNSIRAACQDSIAVDKGESPTQIALQSMDCQNTFRDQCCLSSNCNCSPIDTLTPQLAGPSFDACSNSSNPSASFLKHCVQRKDSRQRSINVSITTQQIKAIRLLSDLCTPLTF